MRRVLTACALVLFLSGCASEESVLAPAIEFRAALVQAGGCTFHADVMADFDDTVQTFSMDCETDADGTTRWVITAPETIVGVTATVTDGGGTITYDGMAAEFGLLANGNVIPAAAPALTAQCWLSEYIAAAGEEDGQYRVTYEKNFDEKRLVLDTWFENGVPISAEVCYNQQRILELRLSDFSMKQ